MFGWKHHGQMRPAFADEPGPGQESVWDYPRPPALHPDTRRVRVFVADMLIADTTGALRLLETASPPTFYLPPGDVDTHCLKLNPAGSSFCEWKGQATYFDIETEAGAIVDAAWSYLTPEKRFAELAGYFSFYPGKADCFVDDERVLTQPGGFYGGWMTSEIVGPVKGEPGTSGW